MDPYILMVMRLWVSHEFVLCLSHTWNPFQVFTLTAANLTGRPLAPESLLPQISGTSMNLYLLTFKFLGTGKSEVGPIYKRLYFFRKKKSEGTCNTARF